MKYYILTMIGIVEILIIAVILIFSIILHEIAHGMAAYAMGDSTAKDMGRLSLNPIRHIDPFGSIVLPRILLLTNLLSGVNDFVIGWAKPVPVNPSNFRDKRYGDAKVSLAGPGVNLLIALIFGLALRIFFLKSHNIPEGTVMVFVYIVQINIILAVFNLIPLPPLDGSHILFTFLPKSFDQLKIFLIRYGMIILLAIIIFFGNYISLLSNWVFKLIVGL
ncbi:MAG: site-2 protease family protein [Candidatus Paceibacterota bacterium]